MAKQTEPKPPASFEAALAELEGLVGRMEQGEFPLEESIKAYQRGAELIKFCRDALTQAEQRVKLLDDGVLQPFEQKS